MSVSVGLGLAEDARLFALLNIATADALAAAWGAKYACNFWRPVTAIQFAGDSALNPATVSDPSWAPLIVTPNFPSYTSAHSTVSGAAAAVLTSLFGPDYHFSVGSDGLPGVTRSFGSFDAAAAEAGQSRIYGGIHYQFDNQTGLASGRDLGEYVSRNFLLPVEGCHDDGGGSEAPAEVPALPFAGSVDASPISGRLLGGQQGSLPGPGAPTLLPPPAHPDALGASPVGKDQVIQPASSADRLAARRVLDQVFADLGGSMLCRALRGEEAPWAG